VSQTKKREEWQADFYASCLLMPRKMILAAWDDLFPDRKQRVLQPETPVAHPFVEIPRALASIGGFDISVSVDEALERFCRLLAERFVVSPIAMRIRLEKLGLLLRAVPHQRLLASE
jgi:Zn-dependent peptidase ImmA (M78 family)